MRAAQTTVLLSLLIITSCSSGTTQQSSAVATASSPSASPTSPSSPTNQATPAESVAVKPKTDACALLTSKEVESVQGEAPKETKLAGQSAGGFSTSQCFFTLPTFSNSISLLVVQKGEGPDAKDPEEYWRDKFHEDKGNDKDRGRERAGEGDKKKGPEGEEEEEGAPPQRVSGVGEEAYWLGNRVGGALYVLKGNIYLRVSIGGPYGQASKMRKSRLLAQKALARL